jgi:GTP cyclohydrolase I
MKKIMMILALHLCMESMLAQSPKSFVETADQQGQFHS